MFVVVTVVNLVMVVILVIMVFLVIVVIIVICLVVAFIVLIVVIVLILVILANHGYSGHLGHNGRCSHCALVVIVVIVITACTPFAVHYEKIRNHLRETATSSSKILSLAHKYEHLRVNQIQLRFLHFNQHSITLLGIHMRHSAYKREKYTFINANIKVINTILKVNRDNRQTLKCKHYSLTFL